MISSPVEEVKNRLDIVQVVGEYLKLQKAGANYRALCPFHSEKGPSFFVSPARQMYHCFGCSVSGDVFSFVMAIESMEFGDALRLLAQKAGVDLPKRDPAFQRLQSERKRLQEASELAAKFFEKQLEESKAGEAAKEYMKKRGVADESLKAWRIGYAPDTARALLEFLEGQGFREQEVGRAGLLVRSEEKPFDRFRSRIMFPVFNLQSEVIGFGGRILGKEGKDLAKYINTPSTPLYDKGKILYGLDKAKLETRKQDSCVLVEGYMDAILAWQAGTTNVVATSGTALTPFHLQLLKRYTENLFLAFDMDVAGDTATKRGIDLALSQGFNLKVVRLPSGKDPAEAVQENPDTWRNSLKEASSLVDYYFTTTFSRFDKNTAEGKKKAASSLLPVIAKLPNKIEQSHWVSRLADELEVKEEVILEELQKAKKAEAGQRERDAKILEQAIGSLPKTKRALLEERIVVLIFKDKANLSKIPQDNARFMSLGTQEILAGLQKAQSLEVSSLEQVFPKATTEYLKRIALLADLEEPEEGLEGEFDLCMGVLALLSRKERLEEIIKEVKKAEEGKESARLDLLLREFHAITKELSKL
jgi:DNA primase